MAKTTARRPMVGRNAERAELESELRRARAGSLRCVLVQGEPGIGKTRLVTEFLSEKPKNLLVLSARGYLFGSSTPFGLWAEAIDGYLRGQPPEVVDTLCGGSAHDLGGILRSVAVKTRSRAGAPKRPHRPLEGMATLLLNLSRERPIIVHLDDVHLADPSSWEALDYLVHNLGDAPLLIVLCARLGELVGQWGPKQVLLRLEQEDRLKRISLHPLDVGGIRELLDASSGLAPNTDVLVQWLLDRSRGNPLFALGLIDALLEQGFSPSSSGLPSVPTHLSEQVLASVGRLDTEAREVLELLSVIGREAAPSELLSPASASRVKTDAALAALIEVGLIEVRERAAGITYQIVHPVVQDAIYQSIVAPRRRSLHRIAARTLVASGRLAEAAPHLVRSAEMADAEAIDALADAVRQAWFANAFPEAFEILSALLELIPIGDDRGLDVLDLMALEGEWTFHHKTDVDYALCVRVLRKAERLVRAAGDQTRLATLNLHLASFLAWGNGNLAESERRGNAAADSFKAAHDGPRARLALNELAWIRGIAGDLQAQEEAAADLLEAAEAAGDRGAVLMALANKAATDWPRGRFRQAELLYRRCIQIAAADGNASRLRHGHTLLAMTLALEGRLHEARASLAEALSADPESSDVLILEFGAQIDWFAGEFAQVVAAARDAASRFGPRRLSLVLMLGVLAATEMGETAAARSFLGGAAEVVGERRRWMMSPYYRWASGVFAWRTGDEKRAVDELERSSNNLVDIDALPIAMLVLADLVDAVARTDIDAAARAARRLNEIAEQLANDLCDALAAISSAEVDLAKGSIRSAVSHAERAVQVLSGAGYAAFEGRALDALGRSLVSLDRAKAVEITQRAAALFDGCGSLWRLARSRETLRGLGKPGRRAAVTLGPGALTRREREIARLATQGLTAGQIGERLFIGERTVETHLANVYAKLGVRTRVELMSLKTELQG